MKRMFVLLFLTVVLIAGMARAETYTLEQCIQKAMQTDPNLIQFRNAVKLARATVLQQAGAFLPTAGVSYSQTTINRGPQSPQFRYIADLGQEVNVADSNSLINHSYSTGIAFRMTLFNGLSNVWNYLGSKASKRNAEYSFEAAKSDLTFVVKNDYYLVLKSKRDLDVAKEAVKRSDELLKLYQEKYDLGSASLSEVLKQKVQYGNDKLTLVQAENAFDDAKNKLALDMGLPPETDFDIQETELNREAPPDITELRKEVLASHPTILSADANLDSYRYDVRSALGTYMPSVTASYSYGWSKETFSDILKMGPYDHSGAFNLSVNFTIFDGFSRERNLVRAKIGLKNAKSSLNYTRNQVLTDLETAYLAVKLADEKLSVTEETQKSAKEDFDLVQAKYNLGAAAQWEMLDAQVSLSQAQFNTISAEFDYNLALAKLQNAMGK